MTRRLVRHGLDHYNSCASEKRRDPLNLTRNDHLGRSELPGRVR
jgi:hypothetical protein